MPVTIRRSPPLFNREVSFWCTGFELTARAAEVQTWLGETGANPPEFHTSPGFAISFSEEWDFSERQIPPNRPAHGYQA
jgi:hypothetical protein